MIEHNTRFPIEMMGDINSQIGGCVMGRDSVAELVGRYGVATFRAALDTIWDQSEAEARAAIRAIPDGTYTAEALLDNDGLNPGSLSCKVTIVIEDDIMTIDLSELPGEVKAPMNAGRSGGGSTVARLAFRYLLLPEGDANEGTFRPLKLILPEGTIVSARPTSAMGAYNAALPLLIDLVIRALAPAMPNRTAAAHYGTFSTLAYAGRYPEIGAVLGSATTAASAVGAHSMTWTGPVHSEQIAMATRDLYRSKHMKRRILSRSRASACVRIPVAPGNSAVGSGSSGAT